MFSRQALNLAACRTGQVGPVPEVHLTWVTSLQVLKNGNYLIGNFLRGQEGKGAHAFEVTREKKVVWTFADHGMVTLATMVRALEED